VGVGGKKETRLESLPSRGPEGNHKDPNGVGGPGGVSLILRTTEEGCRGGLTGGYNGQKIVTKILGKPKTFQSERSEIRKTECRLGGGFPF